MTYYPLAPHAGPSVLTPNGIQQIPGADRDRREAAAPVVVIVPPVVAMAAVPLVPERVSRKAGPTRFEAALSRQQGASVPLAGRVTRGDVTLARQPQGPVRR